MKAIIVPYPPGIPFVCPGEVITQDIVTYIKALREEGEKVIGVNDRKRVFVFLKPEKESQDGIVIIPKLALNVIIYLIGVFQEFCLCGFFVLRSIFPHLYDLIKVTLASELSYSFGCSAGGFDLSQIPGSRFGPSIEEDSHS